MENHRTGDSKCGLLNFDYFAQSIDRFIVRLQIKLGQATIHDDDAFMREIHWMIIDKYFFELETEEERQVAFDAVHTPLRCIIEVVPEKIFTWDLGKMLQAHDDGVWYGESQKLVSRFMEQQYLDSSVVYK